MSRRIRLDEDHKRMLAYYWRECHSLSKYFYFKDLIPQIKKEMPELWEAWIGYLASEKTLDVMMERLL